MNPETVLRSERLSLGYSDADVITDLDLAIERGTTTAIIGANGCGKSTLLRSLARLLKPRAGAIVLNGRAMSTVATAQIARELAILPQSQPAPAGLTVSELVERGRYPHQSVLRQWSRRDEAAVERALRLTDTAELRDRPVDELSGGQRQRAWIAVILAQDTEILLLDEPTTFLDLAHQLEVLELLDRLVHENGRTVVMVLHDVNQACRYADQVVAIRDRQIESAGTPEEVVDAELMGRVFGISARILPDPVTGTPLCIPIPSRRHRRQPPEREDG